MICPYDCEACSEAACYSDGCKIIREFPLAPCHACGELHILFIYPPLCSGCYDPTEHDDELLINSNKSHQ